MGAVFHSAEEKEKQQKTDPQNEYVQLRSLVYCH